MSISFEKIVLIVLSIVHARQGTISPVVRDNNSYKIGSKNVLFQNQIGNVQKLYQHTALQRLICLSMQTNLSHDRYHDRYLKIMQINIYTIYQHMLWSCCVHFAGKMSGLTIQLIVSVFVIGWCSTRPGKFSLIIIFH